MKHFDPVANVKKSRTKYLFENLHICIDNVEGLRNFVEIEGKELKDKCKIFEILKIFEIEKSETITKSYLELLMEKNKNKKYKNKM